MTKKNYKEVLTTPFETDIRDFFNIAKYFMYYGPNINSIQSIKRIKGRQATKVFKQMISSVNMKEHYKVLQNNSDAIWEMYDLSGEILDFETSRMIFYKNSNETYLNALLRHIRNSLAHGNLYVWKKKKGNFIFMVDYDDKKKRITAKIMISETILNQWKAILESEVLQEN